MSVVSPPRVQSLASRLPHELRQTLASALGALDKHNQAVATSLNSSPFARYTAWTPYTVTNPLVVPATGNNGLPMAYYYQTAAQAIPNNALTVLNFDHKDTDTDSAVTTGAAWKFTVPRPGVYQVSSASSFSAGATPGTYFIVIAKNGAEFARGIRGVTPASNIVAPCVSVSAPFSAGDTIAVDLVQITGAPCNTEGSQVTNWVSISALSLNSPYVPSCFPIDNLWQNQGPPSVVLAQAQDVTTPSSPSNLSMAMADWVMVTQGGQQFVRIRNLPGLLPSTKYAVQVFAW